MADAYFVISLMCEVTELLLFLMQVNTYRVAPKNKQLSS